MKKFLLAGVLVLSAVSAHADLKYTQETTIGDGSMDSRMAVAGAMRTMHAVREGAERSEMTMKMGPIEIKSFSIRYCSPEKTVRFNPDLKIYTEDKASQFVSKTNDNDKSKTEKRNTPQTKETGKMVVTYSVKYLGDETISGRKTRHYKIGLKMVSSGCVGNRTSDMVLENWVADIKDAHPCNKVNPLPDMPNQRPHHSNCQVAIETKGDFSAFSKALSGLVMRSKIYTNGKLISTTTVTSLSQAKLGDDVFKLPIGYKKVTAEEFEKAQQQAMMQGMKGGMFRVPGH